MKRFERKYRIIIPVFILMLICVPVMSAAAQGLMDFSGGSFNSAFGGDFAPVGGGYDYSSAPENIPYYLTVPTLVPTLTPEPEENDGLDEAAPVEPSEGDVIPETPSEIDPEGQSADGEPLMSGSGVPESGDPADVPENGDGPAPEETPDDPVPTIRLLRSPAPAGDGSDGAGDGGLLGDSPSGNYVILPEPDDPDNMEEADFEMGGKEDGFVALDFDGIPASMHAMLDENGIYQVTYVIPDGMEAEIVKLDLAKISLEISILQGTMESDVYQPGDVRVMNIWVKSESGHTYKYQDGSFLLRTPHQDPDNIPENPEYQVVGFDGQTLESDYVGTNWMEISYMVPPILEYYKNAGISDYDIEHNLISSYYSDRAHRNIIADYGNGSNDLSAAIQNLLVSYYSEKDGREYSDFLELMKESETAFEEVRVTTLNYLNRQIKSTYLPQGREQDYDLYYKDSFRWVYGEETVMAATDDLNTNRFQYTVNNVYDVIDYDDGSLHENCVPLSEMSSSYRRSIRNIMIRAGYSADEIPDDMLIEITSDGLYFGFVDQDGNLQAASNNQDNMKTLATQQREYGSSSEYWAWSLQDELGIKDMAIGDYMKDQLDELGEGAWHKANDYFNYLLGSGITGSPEDAAWISFMMANNIDFYISGSNHQDTSWGWENEIRLERVDGDVEITKTGKTIIYDIFGNVEQEIESPVLTEAETSFQIWKYDEGGNRVYLTRTEDVDGNSNNGYVWTDDGTVNIVIDTSGGKLNIDMALLEGQIYYLQEAAAPADYERDTKVYIICDDGDMEKAAELLGLPEGEYSHEIDGTKLNIDSLKTLEIKVLNTKEIHPDIPDEPDIPDIPDEPDEPDVPDEPDIPEEPDVPEIPDTPDTPDFPDYPDWTSEEEEKPAGRNENKTLDINDYHVPLAGLINMNEGDCFD